MAKKKAINSIELSVMMDNVKDDDSLHYIPGVTVDTPYYEAKYSISTGLKLLDTILGHGGLGSGRITEIYGKEKTAKSDLVAKIANNFLMDFPNGRVVYFDQEYALDESILLKCYPSLKDGNGRFCTTTRSSVERLAESILKILDDIIENKYENEFLLIVDSVAALQSQAEVDADMDKTVMMGLPKALSRVIPKFKARLAKAHANLLLVNQIRAKPGQMAFVPDESPGGNALKFYADYRIRTHPMGKYSIEGGLGKNAKSGHPDGFMIKYTTIKNKRYIPDRYVLIPLLYKDMHGFSSGLSDCWSLFYTLKDAKQGGYLKAVGGKYYFKLSDDKEKFARGDFPDVYREMINDPKSLLNLSVEQFRLSLEPQDDSPIKDKDAPIDAKAEEEPNEEDNE